MKREYRNAIAKAIKESDLKGYTWKVTKCGLKWSYCDVEFTFDETSEKEMLLVLDNFGDSFVAIWYGDDNYADCKTIEEAYELATRQTIKKANYLY